MSRGQAVATVCRLSAGKPWRTSERRRKCAAPCQRFDRGKHRQAAPPDSGDRSTVRRAATIGKPSGFRSKAATVCRAGFRQHRTRASRGNRSTVCRASLSGKPSGLSAIPAGKDSATVRPWRPSAPRPACQRFGSSGKPRRRIRHHRKRRPLAGSERRHHRTPERGQTVRPVSGQGFAAGFRQAVANIERRRNAAQPFDRVRRLSIRQAVTPEANAGTPRRLSAVRPSAPPFDRAPPSASDNSGGQPIRRPCRQSIRQAVRHHRRNRWPEVRATVRPCAASRFR